MHWQRAPSRKASVSRPLRAAYDDRRRGRRRVPSPKSDARTADAVLATVPRIKRRVEGETPERTLEQEFGGRRRRVPTLLERRNGLPVRPGGKFGDSEIANVEYEAGFYKRKSSLMREAEKQKQDKERRERTRRQQRERRRPTYKDVERERRRKEELEAVRGLPKQCSDSDSEPQEE